MAVSGKLTLLIEEPRSLPAGIRRDVPAWRPNEVVLLAGLKGAIVDADLWGARSSFRRREGRAHLGDVAVARHTRRES